MVAMQTVHPLKTYRQGHEPPLSQQQLADMLGVSREAVARWETGRDIDLSLVPKIAEVTGISPAKIRPDLATLFRTEAAE